VRKLVERLQHKQRRLQKQPKIPSYLLTPESSKVRETQHDMSRCRKDIDFYDPFLICAVSLGLQLWVMTIVCAQTTLFIP